MTLNKYQYTPQRAWGLAFLYLSLLVFFSSIARVPQQILFQAQQENLLIDNNLSYWLFFIICVCVTAYVYGIYWCHNTLIFGRRLHLFWQTVFGATWGIATGLWMITLTNIASNITNGDAIRTYLLAFFAISLWQALAQSHFWGVYIAPEHDTVLTNKQKVWRAHVPHLCTSLLFLILFNSEIMFIALQMLALILTSIGLRMPVWWDTTAQQPPSTRKGLFGLPRTAGARTIE